jgi:hypothetical protein
MVFEQTKRRPSHAALGFSFSHQDKFDKDLEGSAPN